jgi:hypothetical protein
VGPIDFDWWRDALASLRWNWEEAYVITRPREGLWVAQRRDNRETLRSDSPFGLRELIIADYSARPVPRELIPAQRDGSLPG